MISCFDYIDKLRWQMLRPNQARLSRRPACPRVNSRWRRTPENSQAAVSQKLSQQYSRQRRVRAKTVAVESASLRHCALHPSSPRVPRPHSARNTSSKLRRVPFPSRSHTKCATSWTKIRGNSARVQSNAMRRSRRNDPACTAPRRSRRPRADLMRTGIPLSGGIRRNTAPARNSYTGS